MFWRQHMTAIIFNLTKKHRRAHCALNSYLRFVHNSVIKLSCNRTNRKLIMQLTNNILQSLHPLRKKLDIFAVSILELKIKGCFVKLPPGYNAGTQLENKALFEISIIKNKKLFNSLILRFGSSPSHIDFYLNKTSFEILTFLFQYQFIFFHKPQSK
jgi:hypothetical protein